MIFLLALITLEPPTTTVDLIEVNHYYSQPIQEKPTFVQLIFWDWTGKRNDVVAWKMTHKGSPMPTRLNGKWIVIFKHEGRLMRVIARRSIITYTDYDREIVERVKLPVLMRRGL